MDIQGGCLCGEVRFKSDAQPLFMGKCYCTDCQKETGAGHMTGAAVPIASLTVTGSVKRFAKKGGSGQDVVRIFCTNCGTTLIGEPAILPGIAMVRASLLDDASGIAPATAIFTRSAQPWDQPPAGMVSFPGAPPAP
ncbi:MAG: GFA family protein [Caulobacterales bacterium]